MRRYSHRFGERTQGVGQGREVAMRAVDSGTRIAAVTDARPRAEGARTVATSPVVGRRPRQSNDDEDATQETTETRCSSFERVEVCRHNDRAPPSACAVLAALTDAGCRLLVERGADAGATCRLVFPRARSIRRISVPLGIVGRLDHGFIHNNVYKSVIRFTGFISTVRGHSNNNIRSIS